MTAKLGLSRQWRGTLIRHDGLIFGQSGCRVILSFLYEMKTLPCKAAPNVGPDHALKHKKALHPCLFCTNFVLLRIKLHILLTLMGFGLGLSW